MRKNGEKTFKKSRNTLIYKGSRGECFGEYKADLPWYNGGITENCGETKETERMEIT